MFTQEKRFMLLVTVITITALFIAGVTSALAASDTIVWKSSG
ncbi:unnamed protein product, partial [marine sediment metagenome]